MKFSRRFKLGMRQAVVRRFGDEGLASFEAWSQVIAYCRRRILPSALDPEMLYLPRFVTAGDVCLDIGANVGIYTGMLSRLVGESGCVHSFEPVGYTFGVLTRFVRLLRMKNVRLHRAALGDAVGDLEMALPTLKDSALLFDTPSAQVSAGHEPNVRLERVSVTTLDAFASGLGEQRVSFVKCDAEGAERAIFLGGVAFFRRHAPIVLCEIAARHTERYGYRPSDIFAFFSGLNYVGYALENGQLCPVDENEPPTGNYWFLAK